MKHEEFDIKLKEANEQAEAKAKQLSESLKTTVHPFVFFYKEEFVFGYLKEPARVDKMRSIDMYDQSRTQAGDIILRTSLIKEESNRRILEESPENDPIYLGAISFAIKVVEIAAELLKKK